MITDRNYTKTGEVISRRAERAYVKDRVKGVFLKCPELFLKQARVFNVSEFGMGVDPSGTRRTPVIGHEYDAYLMVGYSSVPVRIRLVHVTPRTIGIEFVDPTLIVRGAIRTFFRPELIGASLRSPSPLQPWTPHLNDSLLLKDEESNALRAKFENGEVTALEIDILGVFVIWKKEQPLELIQEGVPHKISDFWRKDLIKLTRNIFVISPEQRKAIEEALRS